MSRPEVCGSDDRWPCACVKRDRGGALTHIRLHEPDEQRCDSCGCEKPPVAVIDMCIEEARTKR